MTPFRTHARGLFCMLAVLVVELVRLASGAAAHAENTPARTEVSIRSLTGVLEGHQVGGVSIDLIGNIYVADFGEYVFKITPEGEREVFATGLYGASGNAVDKQGNLLQANYYGDSIVRIDRKGQTTPFVRAGLSGPVGLAINPRTDDVYAANCRGNSIARITPDGAVSSFADSPLFHCPNGLAFDPQGNLYVVNFRDNRMLKVQPSGAVTPFATVSRQGLGHLCFKDDRFYVTAFSSHEIYEVTLQAAVKRILGNGERRLVDGGENIARLSFPNGIACSPWTKTLYINEFVNDSVESLPRRAIVRQIDLAHSTDEPRDPADTHDTAKTHDAQPGRGVVRSSQRFPETTSDTIFELRQYTLRPGQRDTLIELFDREFVESQEALGMRVVGQFRDDDNPDRFVWVRAFPNMDARFRSLTAFYHGPVWKAYGRQAGATMVDTDNVLLLHPVDPVGGFEDPPATRPGFEDLPTTRAAHATPPPSIVVATIYSLHADAEGAFPTFFRGTVWPALQAVGIKVRATFQTEHSPNNYPDLPVRSGEHVFVWFASYASAAIYADSVTRLSQSSAWGKAHDALVSYLQSPPQQLHLRPTGRSLLN